MEPREWIRIHFTSDAAIVSVGLNRAQAAALRDAMDKHKGAVTIDISVQSTNTTQIKEAL